MKLQAIVFDFGGVLLDWNPRHLYRKLFTDETEMEHFLTEIGFTEWNAQLDKGHSIAEGVASLCEQFPHRSDLIRAFHERWDESIAGAIQGTVDILARLKQAGYPLYALSNWSTETFNRVRHRYDFLNWFDLIVVSGEVGYIKPDPRIYNLLLEKTGRKAEECVFIDDAPHNVEAARQLGFTAIRFESPAQLEAKLRELKLLL